MTKVRYVSRNTSPSPFWTDIEDSSLCFWIECVVISGLVLEVQQGDQFYRFRPRSV